MNRSWSASRPSLYVTAAPIYDHRFSVLELAGELRDFVKARDLGVVLVAPKSEREGILGYGPEGV